MKSKALIRREIEIVRVCCGEGLHTFISLLAVYPNFMGKNEARVKEVARFLRRYPGLTLEELAGWIKRHREFIRSKRYAPTLPQSEGDIARGVKPRSESTADYLRRCLEAAHE